MQQIYKQTLDFDFIGKVQVIRIQKDFDILDVQMQGGKIALWYLCNDEKEMVDASFFVLGTGMPFPIHVRGVHRGTVQREPYVVHVLQVKK